MTQIKFKAFATLMLLIAFTGVVNAEDDAIENRKSEPLRNLIPNVINKINNKLGERPKLEASTTIRVKAEANSSTTLLQRAEKKREDLRRIATNKLNNIIRRFEATIKREEMIMTKIISRIEKVKSAGGNTTESEKFIEEARGHFTLAKNALLTFKNSTTSADVLVEANINSSSTSKIIKNGLDRLKELANGVEKHIRNGHKSLEKAVKSLRGMSSVNANSSTTVQTNNQSN